MRVLRQGAFGAQSGADHLRLHTPSDYHLFCPVRGGMAWDEGSTRHRQSSRYGQTEGQKARGWEVMIWKALAIAAAVLLCLCYAAHGESDLGDHAKGHNLYSKWPGCCGDGDCFESRMYEEKPTGWRVRIYGKWYSVPKEAVTNYPADGLAHVCFWMADNGDVGGIYCFNPPPLY